MKIAILDDYQNVALALADWDSLNEEVVVFSDHLADEGEVAERLSDFEVVVAMRERTPFPAGLVAKLPNLKLLITTGPRNAAIDLAAARDRGIVVCGTGYDSSPTIEFTWSVILGLARHIHDEAASVRAGGWQQDLGFGLNGKTLGLLGLGRVGSAVAKIGQAFGMHTIAWSQNLTQEKASEHGVTAVSKDELFEQSDILSVHVVLSERTRDLIGAQELAAMKPTALLINTSRGPIVNEAALLQSLTEASIGGAAIDVFETEPLPADHPLRGAPRTLITPHLGYVTKEMYDVFYRDAAEDIRAYISGDPIRIIS